MSSPGPRTFSIASNGGKARGSSLDRHDIAVSATYDPSDVVAADVYQRARDRHVLLLTDFDGTLSDLVDDPGEAHLSADVAAEVSAVSKLPRVTFGIVSGRGIADVHPRVGSAAAFTAGLHGLEIDGADASFRHPALDAARPLVASVVLRARLDLARYPRVFIEDKTYSVTCHVRGVRPELIELVLDRFVEIAAPHVHSGVLKFLSAAEALELLPHTSWNKGEAVRWIRNHLAPRTARDLSVVYLGDDRTDEDAFAVLGDEDVAIGVGERPHDSAIDWRLAGPASVGRFFRHLTRLRRHPPDGL